MGNGRKRKINFSKIYTFKCARRSSAENDRSQSQIGGPGFSRVVYCNEPDGLNSSLRNYATNYVRTTKYTPATFLPKSLFEQFRRVANFFFLVTAILSFTPLAPYSAISAVVPLTIVIGATMVKEGIEDWRRNQQKCLCWIWIQVFRETPKLLNVESARCFSFQEFLEPRNLLLQRL